MRFSHKKTKEAFPDEVTSEMEESDDNIEVEVGDVWEDLLK